MKKQLLFLLLSISLFSCVQQGKKGILSSPDGKISLQVNLENGNLVYEIALSGDVVLEKSPLGIVTQQGNWSKDLSWVNLSIPKEQTEFFFLPLGKKNPVSQIYKEQIYTVKNPSGNELDVTFRIFNDGVAYSYTLKGVGKDTVLYETSGFKFPETTTAFVSPLAKAKTSWARTNPSYEEQYQRDIPVGTPSDYGQGWIYPALFKVNGKAWALLSETGVDGRYVATHLADNSDKGLYKVEFPPADHNLPEDPATASVELPATTPWRTITIGKTLHPIVESTMAQNPVQPKYAAKYNYKPGKASWSWLVLKDNSVDPQTSRRFIDMAAALNFEYCLIDGWWDQQTGKEEMKKLSEYAQSKKVGLLLWYNSNGTWNDAPQTPKDKMAERSIRREEMAWMQSIGIKGIKVDFFGGDKQRVMQLYEDILTDANDFSIAVNFHGCTLPRGWDRMFPNFVPDESVMGMEFCTFDQINEDKRPAHATTLPFTRNAVAPMDFTPVILNPRLGETPDTGPVRVTSVAFELALPVIFHSSIEHFGLIPQNLSQFPDFVWNYFRFLPSVWDETQLIDGYPGKEVVMARRSGKHWYVAGINGEATDKVFQFVLPPVKNTTTAKLITEQADDKQKVQLQEIILEEGKTINVNCRGYGGFVLMFNE
jgi:hypothetical protein